MTGSDFKNINSVIKSWASKTQLPLKIFANALDLKPEELLLQFAGKKRILRGSDLDHFAEKVGIQKDRLITGEYEPGLLRRRLQGEVTSLPERYDKAKYSRIRTTSHIIEYLQFTRGWDFTEQLLERHDLKSALFDQLDEKVNILFFMDLLEEFKKANISDTELMHAAYHSPIRNMNTPLGQQLSMAKSNYELYKIFGDKVREGLFDTNFDYKMIVENHKATFYTYISQKLQDELKLLTIGSRQLCLYRHYLFGSLPIYRGESPLKVHEAKCFYLGDSHCEFSVDIKTPSLTLLRSE